MNYGNLAKYGRSRTWSAWATNPVRRVLWWLIAPYFRGAEIEFSDRLAVDSRFLHLLAKVNELNGGYEELKGGFERFFREGGTDLETKIGTLVSYSLRGMKMDATAVAHRLASLEGENSEILKKLTELEEGINASSRKTLEHIGTELSKWQSLSAERLATLENSIQSSDHNARERLQILESNQSAATDTIQRHNERFANLEQANLLITERHSVLAEEIRSTVQVLKQQIDIDPNRSAYAAGGLVIVGAFHDARLLVRRHDLIGQRIISGVEWEPHVRRAIEQASRPDAVAVDAGAYIGVHTLTMARCFRTVHAFEPQRGIFQVLCGNLALNEISNVVTYNAALYDRPGIMRLASQEHQEIQIPYSNGHPDYARLENAAALTFDVVSEEFEDSVRCMALDDLALKDVALIKSDVQGADFRFLSGAERTIAQSRPIVLFEYERDLGAQHGTTLDDYESFFRRLGYKINVLQETSKDRQIDFIAVPL